MMKLDRLLVKVMRDSNFAFGWKYMVLESERGLVSPTWMYAIDPKKYDLVENEYYELEVDINRGEKGGGLMGRFYWRQGRRGRMSGYTADWADYKAERRDARVKPRPSRGRRRKWRRKK